MLQGHTFGNKNASRGRYLHFTLLPVFIIVCLTIQGCIETSSGSKASIEQLYPAPAPAKPNVDDPDPADRVSVQEVEAVAAEADKGYADGWIDGRDPRVFKSPYKSLSPLKKAQFAMAYREWIEKSDQNLAQSYKTYIPYKKRVQFARQYWESSDSGPEFKKAIEKMQVAWIHESLLDGGELWWRAAEKHFGAAINSVSQMAHDVEQNMVSKYMEDEGTESTFSQQMSVKTHAGK